MPLRNRDTTNKLINSAFFFFLSCFDETKIKGSPQARIRLSYSVTGMEHDKPESAAQQCHRRPGAKPPLASLMFRDWICVLETAQAVSSWNL